MAEAVERRAPRILVVDDEETIRQFAERALRGAGYEVAVAADGQEALRLVDTQFPFDAFVLDVLMPQMRGDELGRLLRRREPDVKVLYFTGYSDRLFEDRKTLWEHEAFIEKPVALQGLLEAVSMLLFGHINGFGAGRGSKASKRRPSESRTGVVCRTSLPEFLNHPDEE
jgi:two-component system, cell cycle sensor histidine kinase and response regulator CckA